MTHPVLRMHENNPFAWPWPESFLGKKKGGLSLNTGADSYAKKNLNIMTKLDPDALFPKWKEDVAFVAKKEQRRKQKHQYDLKNSKVVLAGENKEHSIKVFPDRSALIVTQGQIVPVPMTWNVVHHDKAPFPLLFTATGEWLLTHDNMTEKLEEDIANLHTQAKDLIQTTTTESIPQHIRQALNITDFHNEDLNAKRAQTLLGLLDWAKTHEDLCFESTPKAKISHHDNTITLELKIHWPVGQNAPIVQLFICKRTRTHHNKWTKTFSQAALSTLFGHTTPDVEKILLWMNVQADVNLSSQHVTLRSPGQNQVQNTLKNTAHEKVLCRKRVISLKEHYEHWKNNNQQDTHTS